MAIFSTHILSSFDGTHVADALVSLVEISASESENSLIHPNKNNYIVRIIFNSGILANLKFGNLFDKKTRIFKVKLEI